MPALWEESSRTTLACSPLSLQRDVSNVFISNVNARRTVEMSF